MIARFVGVAALVALSAFGVHEVRADETPEAPAEAAAAPDTDSEEAPAVSDLDRYCQLKRDLDQAGAQFFRENQDSGKREFHEAGREFLSEHAVELEELQQVAPPAVEEEVRTFVHGATALLRGGKDGPSASEGRTAERRLERFGRGSCD